MISPELHSNLFIIWMVLSIIAFIALMAWTLWPSHRSKLESYADMPLRNDGLNDNAKEIR